MEKLLDLIFSNLFFVVIVLGAILNFLSRLSKGGETKQEQPKKKPFLDDIGDVFKEFLPFDEDEKEENQNQERKQSHRQEPVEEAPHVNEFEKKRLELEALKKQELAAFKRVQAISQTTESSLASKSKGFVLNVKEIGKEDIAKGVIWSEVLCKPRALNPHHHSRRQV